MIIDGCLEVPDSLTKDEFWDIFIDFVESHKWYFGGYIGEYKNDD